MLLLLKCHEVSLEVILENGEKNSSGCFAWSWKVSVPKKVSGKTRGEEREVEREKTAAPLLWSLQCKPSQKQHCAAKKSFGCGYQKKLCLWVPKKTKKTKKTPTKKPKNFVCGYQKNLCLWLPKKKLFVAIKKSFVCGYQKKALFMATIKNLCLWLQKKLCRGLLAADIYFDVWGDARRKSALPGKPGMLWSIHTSLL